MSKDNNSRKLTITHIPSGTAWTTIPMTNEEISEIKDFVCDLDDTMTSGSLSFIADEGTHERKHIMSALIARNCVISFVCDEEKIDKL